MKQGTLIILFILCMGNIQAQQKKTNNKVKFAGLVSGSLLIGESQKLAGAQVIGGIRFTHWFTGIGAALDEYGYRSIPVFIDARRYFGNKTWRPFVYADAGVNLALYSNRLPKKMGEADYVNFTPAFFGETGIGIDKQFHKKLRLYMSTGFSYKQFSYVQYIDPFFINPGSTLDYSRRYNYYYNRIAVRVGLQF